MENAQVKTTIFTNLIENLFLLNVFKADNLRLKFEAAFKPDQKGNVNLEPGVSTLKTLNINLEDAIITEIKGLKNSNI